MAQIGNIPEIKKVKENLEKMRRSGLIKTWELPYENLLTRLSAAIFFITANSNEKLPEIWEQLSKYEGFKYEENDKKSLSNLDYRIEFNKKD